jgi:hypothetical protein
MPGLVISGIIEAEHGICAGRWAVGFDICEAIKQLAHQQAPYEASTSTKSKGYPFVLHMLCIVHGAGLLWT